MSPLHPQFITDTAGKKLVVLPANEFNMMIEELEELEDIRLYDEAQIDNEPSIAIDEAFEALEAKRSTK
jgi:PHD/YefM family antitoxin component YafN of YafNO toxin-antitoxin module